MKPHVSDLDIPQGPLPTTQDVFGDRVLLEQPQAANMYTRRQPVQDKSVCVAPLASSPQIPVVFGSQNDPMPAKAFEMPRLPETKRKEQKAEPIVVGPPVVYTEGLSSDDWYLEQCRINDEAEYESLVSKMEHWTTLRYGENDTIRKIVVDYRPKDPTLPPEKQKPPTPLALGNFQESDKAAAKIAFRAYIVEKRAREWGIRGVQPSEQKDK